MILPEGYAMVGHTIIVQVEHKDGVPYAIPIATIGDYDLMAQFISDCLEAAKHNPGFLKG